MTHRLSPSPNGWYVLIGPYDPALIEALKAAVPPQFREWRPTAKAWRIDARYREVVQKLIDGRSER